MSRDVAGQTRGERNNNPGNIDYNPRNSWQGQLGLEEVPNGACYRARFARFDTMANGLRALMKLLRIYQQEHGCRTVRQIIARWAPASENDLGAYIADVCRALGIEPDDTIDLTAAATLQALVRAIVRHENGRCLIADDVLAGACRAALA